MATQVDARVKQKTGVAADFAGYVLLEGEIALVRTSASGPVWNFKVGPGDFDSLDWSLQNPGAAQEADTSTVFPTGVPGLYIPTEDGTYEGVSVDLSVGYVQLIWDGSTLVKVEFPIDLAGYATKNEAAAIVDFEEVLVENANLFDKERNLRVGVAINSTTGEDLIQANSSRTGLIYVGENTRVFVLKSWTGSPSAYAWYDGNKAFISFHTAGSGIPDSPGGEIPVRPANARYFSMNVTNDNATQLPSHPDNLMVYVGNSLISYSPYRIYPDISKQYLEISREDSYYKGTSAMFADSVINRFTEVSSEWVGRWQVRTTLGASVAKTSDYVTLTLDGSGVNAGLLLPFFKTREIGMKVWLRFEAKYVSGYSSWRVYFNDATGINIDIMEADWQEYTVSGTVGLNQFGDGRMLFCVNPAQPSEIQVRNFAVYFTDPNPDVTSVLPVLTELNMSAMPNLRYKASALLASLPDLLVISILGDSWTQSVPGALNYVRWLSKALRAKYGNGGGGFYDFSSSSGNQFMRSADIDDATDTRSGTITYKDQTADAKGVNLAHAEFATGATLALNVLTAHEGFVIHYFAGSTYGTFRYRIDGGTWNTVDTSVSTGHQTIAETVADSTHTLEFECMSGTCIILGVDMQRLEGVRVHKLGNRGSRAHNYPEVDSNVWKAAFAALDSDSMTILLGTNDRTAGRTPAQYKSDIEYLVDMADEAIPYIDVALISPSNNRNTETYEMQDYANQLISIAEARGLPYASLIPLFGSTSQIIAKGTFSDAVHPTAEGGRMIADFLVDHLL